MQNKHITNYDDIFVGDMIYTTRICWFIALLSEKNCSVIEIWDDGYVVKRNMTFGALQDIVNWRISQGKIRAWIRKSE